LVVDDWFLVNVDQFLVIAEPQSVAVEHWMVTHEQNSVSVE
jgi:hypothetical protein